MSRLDRYAEQLEWIGSQTESMVGQVTRWACVNTGSLNVAGLRALAGHLKEDFAPVGGEAQEVSLPPWREVDSEGRVVESPLGSVLRIRKRPQAPVQVLLVGHMDTVFGPHHPFQQVARTDRQTLRGPGVIDAKGALAVMLKAIEALERSPWAERVGWEAWVSPDEELGSPGSGPLLVQAAGRCRLGLVFEPSHPDGALVGARKGSGNFTAVVRGRTAHAGRNPEQGRNAIHALADFILALRGVESSAGGIRINVGRVEGGQAVNVVPDLALCRFNVRVGESCDQVRLQDHLDEIVRDLNRRDGIAVEVEGSFSRPPRTLDAGSLRLYEALRACGQHLGLGLDWKPSGGVSDANLLAVAGLPAADGLGPRGGGIHTEEEHLFVESLPERAQVVALFLMKLGAGEIPWQQA